MKNSLKYFEQGFSLLEFAVVLAAMGILSLALVRTTIMTDLALTKRIVAEVTAIDLALSEYQEKTKGHLPSGEGMSFIGDTLDRRIMRDAVNKDGALASKYGYKNYWILVDLDSLEENGGDTMEPNSGGTGEKRPKENASSLALVLTGRDRDGSYGLGSITAIAFEKLNLKFGGLALTTVDKQLNMANKANVPQRDPEKIRGMEKINISDRKHMENLKKMGRKYNLIIKLSPRHSEKN